LEFLESDGSAVGADNFARDPSHAPSVAVSAAHFADSCAAFAAAGTNVVSWAFGVVASAAGFSERPFKGDAVDFAGVSATGAAIASILGFLLGRISSRLCVAVAIK
jgi:hypothetical protein